MEGEKELDIDQDRFNAIGSILLFYSFPIVALTVYAWWSRESWNILILGLFLACFGTYFLARLLYSWSVQAGSQVQVEPEPMKEENLSPIHTDERVHELEQQVQAYSQMVEDWKAHASTHEETVAQVSREHEETEGRLDALTEEYEQYKLEAQHLIEEERGQLEQQRQTLVDQKNALEEKHQQIIQLETKVKDLNFEIKTLLQLAEKEGHNEKRKVEEDFICGEVRTGDEALMELKRCVDAAQRIVGMQGSKLGLDSSSIDSRRLFERLNEVKTGAVFVYSPQEKRALFANEGAKAVWGLSGDHFLQKFNEGSQAEPGWSDVLQPLSYRGETKVDLQISGMALQGWAGVVPTGLFRGMVIGFCYR